MVRGYVGKRTYLWIFASLRFSFYMYFFFIVICVFGFKICLLYLSVKWTDELGRKSIVTRLMKVIRINFVIITNNACQSLRFSKLVRKASFEAKKVSFIHTFASPSRR